MYPTNKADTDRMADLLKQAHEALEDRSDVGFNDRYTQLNDIVQWSYAKHKTWRVSLIIGVLLFAFLLMFFRSSNQDDVKDLQVRLANIEAWTPEDTTISWEKSRTSINYKTIYKSANNWKAARLAEYKSKVIEFEKNVKTYQHQADTSTTDKGKKYYLEYKDKYIKYGKENREKFDELAPKDFKQVQKAAIAECKKNISSTDSSTAFTVFIIFVFILLGLYVWTGNPYGYQLTKSRTRDKILGWVRSIGFWCAKFFFGAGLAAKFFADHYVVEYSSGRKEVQTDTGSMGANLVFKGGLMAVGALIFMSVSLFIVFVETVGGVRNKIE